MNDAEIKRPNWTRSFFWILSRQSKRGLSRLARELDIFRVDFSRVRQRAEKSGHWIERVEEHLRNAELYYSLKDVEGAWGCLHAARREAVYGLSDDDLAIAASAIMEEAHKIDSWRAAVIEKILERAEDKPNPACVVQAMALRDEYFANEYHKIWLAADQIAMLLIITAVVGLGYLGFLGVLRFFYGPHAGWQEFWGARRIANVLLMGYLGAAFSSAQSLIKPPELKIPQRVANHSVTIARVIFGAVAGLAGYSFLQTKILLALPQAIGAELTIAFLFGYAGDVAIAGLLPKLTSSKS